MRFEVYRTCRGGVLLRKQWRWRLKAGNGEIIATSGEGYNNRRDCLTTVQRIRDQVAGAPIKGLD
jgi:uncharacterized protein YegP (UPF0339 family)